MIVVATCWREAVPFSGIALDARKLLMVRNFQKRLERERRETHYNVIIDYAQSDEVDNFIMAHQYWNFTPILFGTNIINPGIGARLAALVVQWLNDSGKPVERRYIQCSAAQKQALGQLGLDECALGNAECIKQAYRRLALSAHPDRHPDRVNEYTAEFERIAEAYKLLLKDCPTA